MFTTVDGEQQPSIGRNYLRLESNRCGRESSMPASRQSSLVGAQREQWTSAECDWRTLGLSEREEMAVLQQQQKQQFRRHQRRQQRQQRTAANNSDRQQRTSAAATAMPSLVAFHYARQPASRNVNADYRNLLAPPGPFHAAAGGGAGIGGGGGDGPQVNAVS